MSVPRISIAALFAVLATLALFFLMISLLGGKTVVSAAEQPPSIKFVKMKPPEDPPAPTPPKPPEMQQVMHPPQIDISLPTDISPPVRDFPAIEMPPQMIGANLIGSPGNNGPALVNSGPVKRATLAPQYPMELRIRGIEGRLVVAYTVTELGLVQDITIVQANPPRVFDQAVIRALKRWRFQPAMVDGAAISSQVQDVIVFELEEE